MRASRRTVLKSAGIATIAVGTSALGLGARRPDCAIYDSRIAESRAFAAAFATATLIDIARQEAEQWRGVRIVASGAKHIVGLTGWSDWVALRSLFEERGLRRRSDIQVAAPLSGMAHLFKWEMA